MTDAQDAGRSPVADELETSSEVFLAELHRVERLEQRKRATELGSEAQRELAQEVEAATLDLLLRSRYQTRLVELETSAVHSGTPRRPAAILDEWRAAQRRVEDLRRDLERAADETERLRAEHHRSAAYHRD